MVFSFLQGTPDRHRVRYLTRPYFTISGHVTETEMTAHIGFINLCTACVSIGKEIFFISYTYDNHNERESVRSISYRKLSMK